MKLPSDSPTEKSMSDRLGEEVGKAGPSCRSELEEEEEDTSESGDACSSHSGVTYQSSFQPHEILSGQGSSMSGASGAIAPRQNYPLKVKRPGRPRIHPPKPAGISKPRGRPRGSKNKKPRKRRDPTTVTERPPKRPRGRPRKWPPEMWEGFQRSQFAATQHMQQLQRQQQQQQHPQEMLPGPSHLYYEDHILPHHDDVPSTVPPPLSHLPYMVRQHETQELSHLMQMPPQTAIPQHTQPHPPQQLHLQHAMNPSQIHQHEQQQFLHQQEEQMLLVRPLYMQEQERHLREHELMMSPEEEQRFYLEGLHPPHTTS